MSSYIKGLFLYVSAFSSRQNVTIIVFLMGLHALRSCEMMEVQKLSRVLTWVNGLCVPGSAHPDVPGVQAAAQEAGAVQGAAPAPGERSERWQ